MRKTLRFICLSVALLMAVSLCACGKSKSSGSTLIFGKTDLSEYVTLGEYKSLTADTSSDKYKSTYEELFANDVKGKDLYTKKYEGKVAEGDIANIDYMGKKDGVAFEGGTAQGYDLTIGSHTFIDGFEEGLIGADIGSTVDLNLTFPENYQSEELAGAAVVFTVTVNYVKSSENPDINSVYSELGFKSVEDYESDLKERAVKSLLAESVVNSSEVSGCPESDKKIYIDAIYDYYVDRYKKKRNVDFDEVLKTNNMTVEDFKNQMSSSVEANLEDSMVYYAILKKENLKAEYDLKENESVGQSVLDEITKTENVVKDFLYKNAKIK